MTAVLLAHQGGWDEILMVLVPIAIFALLLVVANRRANSIEEQQRHDTDGKGSRGDDAGHRQRSRKGRTAR